MGSIRDQASNEEIMSEAGRSGTMPTSEYATNLGPTQTPRAGVSPDKPKTHRVKSWSQFFWPIKHKIKLHDLRKNDRDYRVGDTMILQEYDMVGGRYTGEEITALVTFITSNQFPCAFSSAVLPADYCILSLRVQP